jgi:prefoldin subunit 5
MLKKVLLVTLGTGLIGAVVVGRDVGSYLCTSAGHVKQVVKDAVPVEFEIDRARDMIHGLVPDIRHNMHLIAKEEVEVDQLKRRIERLEAGREKDRDELMRLRSDLTSDRQVFQYAGRSYTAVQVKTDLANRFERFKTTDQMLDSLRQMQEARERSLTAARQKLEGMLATKRNLEVEVERLDAQLKMVEAAQTTSEFTFDDSRLSRAKELVADLQTRLEVAEKLVHSEDTFRDEIPLEETAPEDVVEAVTRYFEPAQAEGEVKVAAQLPREIESD